MNTKYFIIPLIATLLFSCKQLDYDEGVGYKKEDMFTYFARTKGILTNVYSYLPSDFGTFDGAMQDAGIDDAEYVWNNSIIHKYNNGTWSSISPIDDVWSRYYAGIRAAHVFLENKPDAFEAIKWNAEYPQIMAQYKHYPFEARFLRAFFYFELIKRYKNVPLVTRSYSVEEVNGLSPATFDEVVDFIKAECDAIEDQLPANFSTVAEKETGRITKGAVMALRSRTLLYAASPLHNPSNVKQKWIDAAQAAKKLIDFATTASTYQLVNELNVNNLNSRELILERRQGNTNTFEALNFPIGYEGGKSGTNPSQNLVDAFEMKDGSKFDWSNPDHVSNIYNTTRRDPRLFKTVIVNGSTWKSRVVETFIGGRNGLPQNAATLTSYYLKKYLVESISLDPNNITTAQHTWVLFRYSEILLNYAEALYEAYGDANYIDANFNLSPLAAVNRVRLRSTMPALVVNDFRSQVRNERRVEFAFEGHRFWDIRRWKIANQLTDVYGLTIEKNGTNYTYTKKLIAKRVWNDRMYLYPISNTEIFKNNLLKQNPGW